MKLAATRGKNTLGRFRTVDLTSAQQCGWMHKAGGVKGDKKKKARYFQMGADKDGRVGIRYYSNDKMAKDDEQGNIDAASVERVEPLASADDDGMWGLTVTVPGREYKLFVSCKDDRDDWLSKIRAICPSTSVGSVLAGLSVTEEEADDDEA